MVQLLVERGADVHARDEEGETALYHCAVIRAEHLSDAKATEIAKILLAAGADPNAIDKDGTTHPLELAKSRKKKKLCQTLEAAGSRYFEVEIPVQTAAKKPAKIDNATKRKLLQLLQDSSSDEEGSSGKSVVTPPPKKTKEIKPKKAKASGKDHSVGHFKIA